MLARFFYLGRQSVYNATALDFKPDPDSDIPRQRDWFAVGLSGFGSFLLAKFYPPVFVIYFLMI